ncbi:MAG: GNAT family N-acetyltransferase [Pseudomonas sp.]|nr:GNAT family N-acetyltransferase [Pseudomonas sp.]
MEYRVRLAAGEDAEAISQVIVAALRETNGLDYSPEVIARVEQSFTPQAIKLLMARREVYVILRGPLVAGTASLDGDVVRSMFVAPNDQGTGLGRQLMTVIMASALNAGVEVLRVPSSVTAQGFYAKLGFEKVRDEHHGEERTVVMQRRLCGGGLIREKLTIHTKP